MIADAEAELANAEATVQNERVESSVRKYPMAVNCSYAIGTARPDFRRFLRTTELTKRVVDSKICYVIIGSTRTVYAIEQYSIKYNGETRGGA